MKHYLCSFTLSLALSCQSTGKSDASSHQAAEQESRTAPPTSEPSADVQDVSPMMAPELAEPEHSPNVLSVAWVQQKSTADPEAAAKAQALELEAHRLYQSGKDADAVRLYERAALEHATAPLYYRFANSLSNVDRLEDAVKAYLIADDLGYEHPELVHYNLACAYSRLEQREPAFHSLDQAIQSGYSATDKLATDPDLAFLRGLPEWRQRLALYRPEVGELVGRYVEYDFRDVQDHYLLCPGGGVVTEQVGGMDDSCCGSTLYGKLVQRRDQFVAQWSRVCGYRGINGRKHEYPTEICQSYRGCSKKLECRNLDTETKLFEAQTLMTAHKPTLAPEGQEPGTNAFVFFEGEPPDLCKQTPPTLKDKPFSPSEASAPASSVTPPPTSSASPAPRPVPSAAGR